MTTKRRLTPWMIGVGIVTFLAAGECRVRANQAGNANYLQAAQVQQTIIVSAP